MAAPKSSAQRKRLETKAILLGYAMSRLDRSYLKRLGYDTWRKAFAEAARSFALLPATFKNLRDEFDPVHVNPRRGWHKRTLRPSRQRVLDELSETSDEALAELVIRILHKDDEPVVEAIDSLSVVTRVAHNVAERLLTGRRAEEYFLKHCEDLVGVEPEALLDCRASAQGYDFGVQSRPEWAIEVKGMKYLRGNIQFTDREWTEAGRRRSHYWVVVIGGLEAQARGAVVRDPHSNIRALCRFQKTLCAIWRARFAITGTTARVT